MLVRGNVVGVAHATPFPSYSQSRRLRVAPVLKALLVAALCRLSWQRQVQFARTVRSVWPGFSDA